MQRRWFRYLHTAGVHSRLGWLGSLSDAIESIVSFGCWRGSEPFALLWILDAGEVSVVEKQVCHIKVAGDKRRWLEQKDADSLAGRSVSLIVSDVARPGLPSEQFDLAFCRNVLYQVERQSGMARVQTAISEMTRVVKPGGWVIAVEGKIGVEFKEEIDEVWSAISGSEFSWKKPTGQPEDISGLFEAAGLTASEVPGSPRSSYCYCKPHAALGRDA